MNERIKELAEQAGCYQETDYDGKLFWAMPEDSWEKFAELIVRKCIDIIHPYEDDDHYIEKLIERDVRKYFGVEE